MNSWLKNHKGNNWIPLTHWGRVMHICVSKLNTVVSDNGLSPGRRQAIIRTNAGILLIGPPGTNFSEILIGIQIFSIKIMQLKMASAKWRPFCLGLNVLKCHQCTIVLCYGILGLKLKTCNDTTRLILFQLISIVKYVTICVYLASILRMLFIARIWNQKCLLFVQIKKNTPARLQPHANSFGEPTKCSDPSKCPIRHILYGLYKIINHKLTKILWF